MTIGDMRRLMLKKVVPESVVPQNIVDFLIDENAQLPEPDAFTFLTRLRGLGIGSADFLYLLEGCGAPQAAVDKIRANPAMTLQGLILTLEGAGMTSKDYTRILYTARQIWERTLTLRLENSERISEENSGTNEVSESEGEVSENEGAALEYENTVSESEDAVYKTSVPEEDTGAPLPHGKPPVAYPDATEELMSVDFGSDYEFDGGDSEDADGDPGDETDDRSADTSRGTVGIGSGGSVDTFGNGGLSGELGYSQSFTESFVNDYMVDFAEDDLAESPEDEDYSDDFGGVYYGGYEQYPDEIPAVGNGSDENAAARNVTERKPTNGIPDAREPFEVHIASYDIPEEPDEFVRARAESKENTAPSDVEDGTGEFEFVTEEEFSKKNTAPFEVKIDYGDDDYNEPQADARTSAQESVNSAFRQSVQANVKPGQPQYNGETTMIVPISREQIEQNISAMSAKNETPDVSEKPETDDKPRTAVQKPSAKTARQTPRFSPEPYDEPYDEDEEESDHKLTDISANFGKGDISGSNYRPEEDKKFSGMKKGVVIAAGVGAAALIGANVIVSQFISNNDRSKIMYAQSADDIFTEIYYSHKAKIAGGDTVSEYQTDYSKVFGDLLICGNGLGTFTAGNNIYSVSENKIAASVFQNGEMSALGQFEPADGTKFVAAFEKDGSLIAVYSGNECGYLKIKGEEVLYTVRQSGKLTDFAVENGEIRIGSVYTPVFYESFKADRTDIYLPKVGTDAKAIEPQNVILSRTKGYSYALSAGYSLEGGTVVSAKAAIGDPVYAGADGVFVMNGSETKRDVTTEYGLLLSAGEEPASERVGKIGCAAATADRVAVYEDGGIILRDREFGGAVKLGNIAKIPTKLRFSGNMLIASDNDGIFLTADCADLSKVTLMTLKQINGDCSGDSAITLEADLNGIKLTRYVLENGTEKEIVSFTRQLTSEQAKTLVCGTANAMVARPDRCGAAYSYFDGVSVISEYVTLSDATEAATLFDDKTGFEYAFVMDGKIYAVCSKGAVDVAAENGGDEDPDDPDDPGVPNENTPPVE